MSDLKPRPPAPYQPVKRQRSPAAGFDLVPEAEWRERARPVYRALEAAGPDGLTRNELLMESWIPDYEHLADVIWWMRSKGVDIAFVRGRAPGEDSRYVLSVALPEAWAPAP